MLRFWLDDNEKRPEILTERNHVGNIPRMHLNKLKKIDLNFFFSTKADCCLCSKGDQSPSDTNSSQSR